MAGDRQVKVEVLVEVTKETSLEALYRLAEEEMMGEYGWDPITCLGGGEV